MRTARLTTVLAAVTLAVISLGQLTRAADIKQQPWRQLKEVKSESEMQALPDKATIAMACAKCKSVALVTKRDLVAGKPAQGQKEVTIMVHQCPGCGGEMSRKAGTKETAWVHTCSKCGDGSAFCCATEPGKPTTGMTKPE
jgi:predicted RNA-binding Zn-ribbon protein involved in translation (DUF1610 family)